MPTAAANDHTAPQLIGVAAAPKQQHRPNWRDLLSKGLTQRVLEHLSARKVSVPNIRLHGISPRDTAKLDQIDAALTKHLGSGFCGRIRQDSRNNCEMLHYSLAAVNRDLQFGESEWSESGLQLLALHTSINRRKPAYGKLVVNKVNISSHAIERLFRRMRVQDLQREGADQLVSSLAAMFKDTALTSLALQVIANEGDGDIISSVAGGALLGVTHDGESFFRTVVDDNRLFMSQQNVIAELRQAAARIDLAHPVQMASTLVTELPHAIGAMRFHREGMNYRKQFNLANKEDAAIDSADAWLTGLSAETHLIPVDHDTPPGFLPDPVLAHYEPDPAPTALSTLG